MHPTAYADLLGKKIKQGSRSGDGSINVWLVNTGWTGGRYGEGSRMELSYTRAMIKAALTGVLNKVDYQTDPVFGLAIPKTCPDVPNAVLNPRDTWRNEKEYDALAADLAARFVKNFEPFAKKAGKKVVNAGPKVPAAK